jgi:hypothetical protein
MSALPAKQNFTAWRGGTWRKQITLYTGADTTSPVRTLGGCRASLKIENPTTRETLKLLTTENGGIDLDISQGTINLLIRSDDTAALSWAVGVYQLLLTNSAGDIEPLLYGQFIVRGI